jgi:hypothetical protein
VVLAALAMGALAGSSAPSAMNAAGRDRGPEPGGPARPFDDTLPPDGQGGPTPNPSASDGSGTDGLNPDGTPRLDGSGIPQSVLAAYKKAQETLGQADPSCHLQWQLLAGIGKVESGHARSGNLNTAGTAPRIKGPDLNGQGFAHIPDTDGGKYDGNTVTDNAVGPMQFIPSTWAKWGIDANDDGASDPNNIFDATVAAGYYLCAGEKDLSVPADLDRAILSYNNSDDYLRTVKSWMTFYLTGAHGVPDADYNPGGAEQDGPDWGGGADPTAGSGDRTRGPGSGDGGGGGGGKEDRPGSKSPKPTPTRSSPRPSPTPRPTSGHGTLRPTTPAPTDSSRPPTDCPSPTTSPSGSPSNTPSETPSGTPTQSTSPSPTPSGSPTDCPSPTASGDADHQ